MSGEKHEFGYSPHWAEKMGFPKLNNPTHPVHNGTTHHYMDRKFRFSVAKQLWKVTEDDVPRRHTPTCAEPGINHAGYCKPISTNARTFSTNTAVSQTE